jgi:hypothetical protein
LKCSVGHARTYCDENLTPGAVKRDENLLSWAASRVTVMHQKMSHQEFQSQAVDRILSEDSILQLIKDLASAFGKPNYVGIYEGLLTKKPQKGLRI